MKILYAIQGTGNGHLSRARDIIPILKEYGDLDILVSGIQSDVNLPFQIKYRFRGLSFIFGKSGGVDILRTIFSIRPWTTLKEISSLPVHEYDIIINDFEPISAWACKFKKKNCIALSHQAALRSPNTPKPQKFDPLGKIILKIYAPANRYYGFHFKPYNDFIFTPIIRSEIRKLIPKMKGYYLVYLPAYDDNRIVTFLNKIPDVRWIVFSKHNKISFQHKNVSVQPIENDKFVENLANCNGVLCGAGFETPAEALYLGKKLLVIPMKTQYEQHCNAKALEDLGIPVLLSLTSKYISFVANWIKNGTQKRIDFPDTTKEIIEIILSQNIHKNLSSEKIEDDKN
jgi:uncharacterized protein (TIGR00661 family)